MFDAYKKLSGSDIEDSIEGETTGNLENLLLAVGKTYYKNKEWYNDHCSKRQQSDCHEKKCI